MPSVRETPRCPTCEGPLDPAGHCPACDTPVDESSDTVRDDRRPKDRPRFPVPWGLFIVLGVYLTAVWAVTQYEHYTSPDYLAAKEVREALDLLGDDDGKSAKVAALLQALEHLAKAIELVPGEAWLHERVEATTRRLHERREKVPLDLQRRLDALALRYQKIQLARGSALPVGVHDVWDVDAALRAPTKFLRYGGFGGAIIVLVWLYVAFQRRRGEAARIEALKNERGY